MCIKARICGKINNQGSMIIRMTGPGNHGSLKGRSIQVSSDTGNILKLSEAYIDVFFTMRGKNMDIFLCIAHGLRKLHG